MLFTNPLLILLPYLYSSGMMKKTLPNFDFTKTNLRNITKRKVFFLGLFIEEEEEEEVQNGLQNCCLGSST